MVAAPAAAFPHPPLLVLSLLHLAVSPLLWWCAGEVSALATGLPLDWEAAAFVAVDESRVDVLRWGTRSTTRAGRGAVLP